MENNIIRLRVFTIQGKQLTHDFVLLDNNQPSYILFSSPYLIYQGGDPQYLDERESYTTTLTVGYENSNFNFDEKLKVYNIIKTISVDQDKIQRIILQVIPNTNSIDSNPEPMMIYDSEAIGTECVTFKVIDGYGQGAVDKYSFGVDIKLK